TASSKPPGRRSSSPRPTAGRTPRRTAPGPPTSISSPRSASTSSTATSRIAPMPSTGSGAMSPRSRSARSKPCPRSAVALSVAGGNRGRLPARQPGAPGRGQVRPLLQVGARLPEVVRGRADEVGQRGEPADVEAVHRRRVQPEQVSRLVDGDVAERIAQPLLGVWPGALRVREVAAPHHVADSDLVATRQLAAPGVRRADGAVAVEVRTRPHREVRGELRAELLRRVLAVVGDVGGPEEIGGPERAPFRHDGPKSGRALAGARPPA